VFWWDSTRVAQDRLQGVSVLDHRAPNGEREILYDRRAYVILTLDYTLENDGYEESLGEGYNLGRPDAGLHMRDVLARGLKARLHAVDRAVKQHENPQDAIKRLRAPPDGSDIVHFPETIRETIPKAIPVTTADGKLWTVKHPSPADRDRPESASGFLAGWVRGKGSRHVLPAYTLRHDDRLVDRRTQRRG